MIFRRVSMPLYMFEFTEGHIDYSYYVNVSMTADTINIISLIIDSFIVLFHLSLSSVSSVSYFTLGVPQSSLHNSVSILIFFVICCLSSQNSFTCFLYSPLLAVPRTQTIGTSFNIFLCLTDLL